MKQVSSGTSNEEDVSVYRLETRRDFPTACRGRSISDVARFCDGIRIRMKASESITRLKRVKVSFVGLKGWGGGSRRGLIVCRLYNLLIPWWGFSRPRVPSYVKDFSRMFQVLTIRFYSPKISTSRQQVASEIGNQLFERPF